MIGWSEVGPGLLQAISTTDSSTVGNDFDRPSHSVPAASDSGEGCEQPQVREAMRRSGRRAPDCHSLDVLLERAKQEDSGHRLRTQKPISADGLRARLGIGSARARRLVEIIRAEYDTQNGAEPVEGGAVPEAHEAVG